MRYLNTWPGLEHWLQANKDNVGNMILTGYFGDLENMPIERLLVDLAGSGKSVLDFGCGIGRNSVALSKKFIEVVGYDLPHMIDLIPESNKIKNIEYTANWENLKNNKFDVVVAHEVLQCIREKELRDYLQDIAQITNRMVVISRAWIDDTNDELEVVEVLRDFFNVNILEPIQHDRFTAILTKK